MNLNYTTGIPNGPNNPSTDQPNMLTNTNSINTILGIDHFSFNNNNGGFHLKSTYVSNIFSLASPPVTIAGQVALYAANTAPGNILAMSRDGQTSGTALTSAYITTPLAANNGYTWFAGGILYQWGVVSGGGSNTGTVNFPFTFTNAVYNVTFGLKLKNASNPHAVWITIDGSNNVQLTRSGFTWMMDEPVTNSDGFFWTAIGS